MKKIFSINNIGTFVLFYLILFLPRHYKGLKICFMLVAIIISLLRIVKNKVIFIKKEIIAWFFIFCISELLFVFMGCLKGNEGAITYLTVSVIWPIVFFILLVIDIDTNEKMKSIYIVIKISIVCIIIYDLWYLAYGLKIIPENAFIQLEQSLRMGNYGNIFEFNVDNFASLYFVSPIIIINFLYRKIGIFKNKILINFLFFGNLIIVLYSGRRALQIIFISFFIILILIRVIKQKKMGLIGKIIIGMILINIYASFSNISYQNIYTNIILAFDNNKESYRYEQMNLLLEGFKENPIIGKGNGYVVNGMISDVEKPWMQEFSYLLKLQNTGLVGIGIYILLISYIIIKNIYIIMYDDENSKLALNILVGFVGILIANFTNPYIAKFDYIWVYFLPLSMINISKFNVKKGEI